MLCLLETPLTLLVRPDPASGDLVRLSRIESIIDVGECKTRVFFSINRCNTISRPLCWRYDIYGIKPLTRSNSSSSQYMTVHNTSKKKLSLGPSSWTSDSTKQARLRRLPIPVLAGADCCDSFITPITHKRVVSRCILSNINSNINI